MDAVYIQIGIGAATFGFTVAGTAWAVRGLIAGETEKFRSMMAEHQLSDDRQFASVRHEMGEVGTAIRTKITQVEFFVRDNFVPNNMMAVAMDGIKQAVTEMREDNRQQAAALKEQVDRLEARYVDDLRAERDAAEKHGPPRRT